MTEDYYLSRKKNLLRSFERAGKRVSTPLINRYGQEFSNALAEKARQEFRALIPQIPFIGGAQNRWTADLVESVQILAVFRAMNACGKTSSETADIINEGMQIRLAQYARFLLRSAGTLQFSRLFLNRLRHQAIQTQKRIYPDNFVAEVVIGDGKEFE